MSSRTIIVLVLLSLWMMCSLTNTFQADYFNRRSWFNDGNILHIEQPLFWSAFQQHRNVNRHIDWLTAEISSVNHQINSVKQQIVQLSQMRQRSPTPMPQTTINPSSSVNNRTSSLSPRSPIKIIKNQRNLHVIKLLADEPLFDGYRQDLVDIYETALTATIECVAVIIERNSTEKYLFIKLSNDTVDSYRMNTSKSLKETYWKINQPMSVWNNASKQLEYYRRFTQDNKTNVIMITDQLTEIKNRPKLNDVHFFYMMGQILRIKYHVDSSSLSCILEVFFDNIYTCDGRLVYPHELRLLSNDKNLFVFHAVMMDTMVDKQIYPLDTNNHIRQGDQIFFLFNSHPQYNSLSTLTCPECVRNEKTFVLNNNPELIEHHVDNGIDETPPISPVEDNVLLTNIQNFIAYAFVTSVLLYVLFGIFISRKRRSNGSSIKRPPSLSARRGR